VVVAILLVHLRTILVWSDHTKEDSMAGKKSDLAKRAQEAEAQANTARISTPYPREDLILAGSRSSYPREGLKA